MPLRAVTGHAPLLDLLARAIARDALPPSLIFSGPDGVGKRTVALALAQALNCEARAPFAAAGVDACGVCAACTRIARGVHADVLVVEPGDTGAIKDRSDPRGDRSRRATGRSKAAAALVIIDRADALLVEAQNACSRRSKSRRLRRFSSWSPPARTAAADGPFALPPAAVRPVVQRGRGRGHCATAHRFTADAAAAAAARSQGSVGGALAQEDDDAQDVRAAASSLLQAAATSADPRRLSRRRQGA